MTPTLLEGPDGGGKTALAEFLAARYDLHRIKNGAPKPDENLVRTYLAQLNENTVIDRAWPSEMIYAPLMKRRRLVSLHDDSALFGELKRVGGRMVICLPPFGDCERAWKGREGELFQDRKILESAWDAYADLAESFRSEPEFCYLHDWTLDSNNAKLCQWLEAK